MVERRDQVAADAPRKSKTTAVEGKGVAKVETKEELERKVVKVESGAQGGQGEMK
jgi:hypothetical protein